MVPEVPVASDTTPQQVIADIPPTARAHAVVQAAQQPVVETAFDAPQQSVTNTFGTAPTTAEKQMEEDDITRQLQELMNMG